MNPLVRGENSYTFGPGGEHVRLRFVVDPRGPGGFDLTAHYHGDEVEVRLGNYQAQELRDVLASALGAVSDGSYLVHPLWAGKAK